MKASSALSIAALLIVLSACASAQFGGATTSAEEIKWQEVKYDDYALQYAIIKKYNFMGFNLNTICSDCTARITVKTMDGRTVIDRKAMTQQQTGLFGYKITRNEFPEGTPGSTYLQIVNVTSALYGSGVVTSQFKIMDNSAYSGGGGGGLGGALLDWTGFGPAMKGAFQYMLDEAVKLFRRPLEYFCLLENGENLYKCEVNGILYKMYEGIKGEVVEYDGFLAPLVKLAISAAKAFVSVYNEKGLLAAWAWAFVAFGNLLAYALFVPAVCVEVIIIGYAVMRNPGDYWGLLGDWAWMNYKAIALLVFVIYLIPLTAYKALTMLVGVFKQIPVVSHLWAGGEG